jgi:hypothetical protein
MSKICTSPTCPEKGKKQDADKFYKCPTSRDGLQRECKVCLKARTEIHNRNRNNSRNNFFKTFM